MEIPSSRTPRPMPPRAPGKRTHRARLPGLVLLALAATVQAAQAQARDPVLAEYEFVSDITRAPALWVNPGALAFEPELSITGHLAWGRPEEGDWATRQYLVGLHTKVLALGYRHDEFAPPRTAAQGDAYSLALAYASEGTGIGVARTWRRGGRPREGSWEIGLAQRSEGPLSIGLVWRDIGNPEVRGTVRPERLIGAVTVRPAASTLAVSAQADYLTDAGEFFGFRVGGDFRLGTTIEGLVRGRWTGDGDFDRLWLGVRVPIGRAVGVGITGLDSDLDARIASLGGTLIEHRSTPDSSWPATRAR